MASGFSARWLDVGRGHPKPRAYTSPRPWQLVNLPSNRNVRLRPRNRSTVRKLISGGQDWSKWRTNRSDKTRIPGLRVVAFSRSLAAIVAGKGGWANWGRHTCTRRYIGSGQSPQVTLTRLHCRRETRLRTGTPSRAFASMFTLLNAAALPLTSGLPTEIALSCSHCESVMRRLDVDLPPLTVFFMVRRMIGNCVLIA